MTFIEIYHFNNCFIAIQVTFTLQKNSGCDTAYYYDTAWCSGSCLLSSGFQDNKKKHNTVHCF